MLLACTPTTPREHWLDYAKRLQRSLEFELPETAVEPELLVFPGVRQLRLPEPEFSMGMLSFLRLDACELQEVIAQRNSSLGKLMAGGHRLAYEHRLQQVMARCLAMPEQLSLEQRQWLETVYQKKQQLAHTLFWNTVVASETMVYFFAASPERLDMASSQPRYDIERSLGYVFQWQSAIGQEQVLDMQALGESFKTLELERYGGRLIRAAVDTVQGLDVASEVIEQRLARRAVCPQGRQTPRSDVMLNIFQKYYLGVLQPHFSRVSRELQSVSAHFFEMTKGMGEAELPLAYRQFYTAYLAPGGLPEQLKQSSRRHVDAWRSLFKQCGIAVGTTPDQERL